MMCSFHGEHGQQIQYPVTCFLSGEEVYELSEAPIWFPLNFLLRSSYSTSDDFDLREISCYLSPAFCHVVQTSRQFIVYSSTMEFTNPSPFKSR